MIARVAQHRERRRGQRHHVFVALLHARSRHDPLRSVEIDLGPTSPAGLVRANGRKDDELKEQFRAGPRIAGSDDCERLGHLGIRQGAVMVIRHTVRRRHGIERRTTRIVLPIPLANSPGRHGSDLLPNLRHRGRCPLSNRLQDGAHMVRFDIAHAESAELGKNIEFKRPSPALLSLLTSPRGPPPPNDVFHGLGKSRNNAVPMRVLVYEGVNPVINKLAVA